MARKLKRQKSKYEDEVMWLDGIVTGFDVYNLPVGRNGNVKTVFTCKSEYEEHTCVIYEPRSINIGDKVMIKGRFADSVFLVWDLLITEKKHA